MSRAKARDEVGGGPVYLRGAECGEGSAGRVDEIVRLEDGLRGRYRTGGLSSDGSDERDREERDGQPDARARLQSNAAA